MNRNYNKRLILEDLVAQKAQYFKDIPLYCLIQFAKLTPEWDDSMENCKISYSFAQDDQNVKDLGKYINSDGDNLKDKIHFDIVSKSKGNQKTLNIELEAAKFKTFMQAATRMNQLKVVPSRNGDNISISSDEDTLKKAYLIWKKVASNAEQSQLKLTDFTLSQEDQKDFAKRLTDPLVKMEIICDNYLIARFVYAFLVGGKILAMKVNNDSVDAEVKEFSPSQLDSFMKSLVIFEGISDQARAIISIGANEMAKNGKSFAQALSDMKKAKIAKKIHLYKERIKGQQSLIFDKVKDENKDLVDKVEKKYKDKLDKQKDAKKRERDLKQLYKKELLELQTKAFSDYQAQNLKGLTQIKSLGDLDKVLEIQDDSDQKQYEKRMLSTRPNPTNACAKRRMKLFDDVLTIDRDNPAKVYYNDQFVVALTYTRNQNHVFGRYKPICVAGSSTEIDESCNSLQAAGISKRLRDHETDTDENGRKREYVKDNIGDGADNLPYESIWCTTGCTHFGGNSAWQAPNRVGHWNNYNNNERNPDQRYPYTIIMQVSDGAMYQYAGRYVAFLFENEMTTHGLTREGNSASDKMKKARERFPKLDAIMEKVDLEYGNSSKGDTSRAYDYAEQNNLVTENNRLIIRSRDEVQLLKPILNDFDGLIIDSESASFMFMNMKFDEGLPSIDCLKVRTADKMFKGTKILGTLILKNTGKIASMCEMFSGARVSKISGLDTSGAENISYIFHNSTAYSITQNIAIPELDLRNCKIADLAFCHCSASKISFKNCDKITSATLMFSNCYALEQIPRIIQKNKSGNITKVFTSIENLSRFSSVIKDKASAQLIFDGCSTLFDLKDFDEQVKQIYDAYSSGEKEKIEEDNLFEVDSRGFAIVRSRDDLRVEDDNYAKKLAVLYRYPGVFVDNQDGRYLFSELDPIRINILDLSKVKNASYMFKDSTIVSIKQVIGAESIIAADNMFKNCHCNRYPKMNFANLDGDFNIFLGSFASREKYLPDVQVGYKVEFNLPSLDKIRADNPNANEDQITQLFNEQIKRKVQNCLGTGYTDRGYEDWANTHGEERLVTWYLKLFDISIASFKTKFDSLEKTKKGYIKVPDKKILKNIIEQYKASKRNGTDSDLKGIFIDTDSASELFTNISMDGIDLPPVDMERVEDARGMFYKFSGANITLENTSNLKNADQMFQRAILNKIPSFDTSHIESAKSMFFECKVAEDYPDDMYSFPALANGYYMFCGGIRKNDGNRTLLDFDRFELPSLTNGESMFGASKLKASKISLPNVIVAKSMFANAHITAQNNILKEISLPLATNCEQAFYTVSFTSNIKVGKIDIHSCINTQSMFRSTLRMTYISQLNMVNATRCSGMFEYAGDLKCIIPIKTEFPRGQNFHSRFMFRGCPLHSIYGMNAQYIYRLRMQHFTDTNRLDL